MQDKSVTYNTVKVSKDNDLQWVYKVIWELHNESVLNYSERCKLISSLTTDDFNIHWNEMRKLNI